MSDHPFDDVTGGPLGVDYDLRPDSGDVAAARRPRPTGGRLTWVTLSVLPWLLALGVATVVLQQTGTPAGDIARYAAYWCFGVTFPGLLVARAAIGSRGNWPEDVAMGAVTGLGLELACFVLWSVLGLQHQLWLWPLVVVAIFAAVPRLRQYWRIRSPKPLPLLWSWGVASAIAVGAAPLRQTALDAPLPPAGGYYYPDMVWHLSIVQELTRSFPPQIPQVTGEMLRYHWFSNVHMAAAQLASEAPTATVVLRLWIIPLLAVTALIGARLVMELSGRWWSGPLAAWTLLILAGTGLLPVAGEAGDIFPRSPSQVYVVPLVLGAALLIVRVLRGNRLGWGWAVLLLLLVTASGAKPTAMPLVLAGTCLAGMVLAIRRRRQWLAALSIAAAVAVILPVSFLAVAGSTGGSPIGLFHFIEWDPLYRSLTGAMFHSVSPILPTGVRDHSGRSLVILAILLLVPLAANLGRLVPFAWLGSKRMRTDPAAWFLAGFVIAGWIVYLVLSHPAYSQAYFLRLANPLATVFGVWTLAVAVPRAVRSGGRIAAMLAAGALIGFVVVAVARALTPTLIGHTQDLGRVEVSFLVPLAVGGAAAVLSVLVWPLLRRRVPSLRGWGSALALAAVVLGAPVQAVVNPIPNPSTLNAVNPSTKRSIEKKPVVKIPVPGQISSAAAASMAWVKGHTPPDAMVATNRHCLSGPERPWCLSMAFWVSGLGGRRTVLEGWGYTDVAKSLNSPAPYPERLSVNDAVFTSPSASTIERLQREYGASWLVADSSAGPVSPELAQYAVRRFSSGPITVYQLR